LKVCCVAPAATTTDDGAAAADGAELVKVIVLPPAGAGPFKVTVPTAAAPPTRLVGDTVRPDNSGRTVIVA
jgi:hypothetical protein